MKIILSLFDGISCARVALERAEILVEVYYASEIDKYAIQISETNYPDIQHIGSVVDFYPTPLICGNIDILVGGSPCQDLSIAGKRKGLSGERSGLFYEYVRILNEVKPKYFILENVNSMSKEAKETITKELFGIEPIMINASLVSAQNRKRLFWVGKLDEFGTYKKVDIEQPQDKGILLKDILEDNVDEKYFIKTERKNTFATNKPQDISNEKANPLLVGGTLATIRIGQIGKGSQADRIYSVEGKSVNLSSQGGGGGAKTGLYLIANNFNKKVFSDKSGTIGTSMSRTSKQGIGIYKDEISKEGFIRKLTPIECERLQGLPDNYTEGISNTQRYKTLGNAFNVDVVAHILKQLK